VLKEKRAHLPRMNSGIDLTSRELDVLSLTAKGLAGRKIASELGISHGTFRRNSNALFFKLGVHSKLDAAAKARELGLATMGNSP
jgi:DNA-binding NarL/FixJ family response regulator